jgi:hypothetical protein
MKDGGMKYLLAALCLFFSSSLTALAQEDEGDGLTPDQRVAKMVVMNENGIISISYAAPWFYEVGTYSASLGDVLWAEMVVADAECKALTDMLDASDDAGLGTKTAAIITSLGDKGTISNDRVLSSLLGKYAKDTPVDAQTAANKGTFTPITANFCTNAHKDDMGMLEQMFPQPLNPFAVGGGVWNVRTCDAIEQVRKCVQGVADTHLANQALRKLSPADQSVNLDAAPRFTLVRTHVAGQVPK